MKNANEIHDYVSFLKAKAELKDRIEFHRQAIKTDLQRGTQHFRPSHFARGFAEKIHDMGEKLYGYAEQFMESKLGQQVSSVVSIASFVKDLFGKAQKNGEEQ